MQKKDFLGPLHFTYHRQGQIQKRQEASTENAASDPENSVHQNPNKRAPSQKTVIRDTIQIDSIVLVSHLSALHDLRELYFEQMEEMSKKVYVPQDSTLVR